MPKREDLKSILVIGAGPIIIGQACEFDYSGTQACKALRDLGYRVVLVNSNPATIMTDPETADATYIEPITPEFVEKIIEKERPCAVLPTMGGQTALNAARALAKRGVLERYGVELIGADAAAIDRAEDRELFRKAMEEIGLDMPKSRTVNSIEEARETLSLTGLPAIIRPSFTLGGNGGGIAYNKEEFERIVQSGLDASPIGEVLIDESVLGWKEFEMEVVRDRADNCIIICSIENVDPMGVHTGDSVTVAPALTLTDKEYQLMRDASIAVLRKIGVDTGGSNVQFAVDPKTGRMVVIEMNPRVSRSSALASKATGFPIAKVAAKLAVGFTLDEIDNDITQATPASFEPSIDYVVVKAPRFTFEKFPETEALLSTAMKSVGEAMAIGRTFQEALQKAMRSLEFGYCGLDPFEASPGAGALMDQDELLAALRSQRPDRLFVIAQAIRAGLDDEAICGACRFDPWFVAQIRGVVDAEAWVQANGLPSDEPAMRALKAMGFSDKRLAALAGMGEEAARAARHALDVRPVFKRVDTCAAEFASSTPYMYSTYESAALGAAPECESDPSPRKKVVILGGGPNRIGQGIEFDYCCVHAAFALRDAGYETIMVNCNPETVSTDPDTSDRLYFEPLTLEDVLELCAVEASRGELLGAIVQLGGQTPLKLAHGLERAGVPILGTSVDAIDLAEDRDRFKSLLQSLDLRQPANDICHSGDDPMEKARALGFPMVIRPSYVLGGRGMRVVGDEKELSAFFEEAKRASEDGPVLMDRFLDGAIEVDVDVIADGENVFVAGVMEHIEEAGVHSGDSACSLPPRSFSPATMKAIDDHAVALAKALGVKGLMNLQLAIKDDAIFVIEVNPRASRTAPFVAKAIGQPIVKGAARIMAGERLDQTGLERRPLERVAVKEAVFPFARFPGVDVLLGPEMKSTGEVMGFDRDFAAAFAKAQIAAGSAPPRQGVIFLSVRDEDKAALVERAPILAALGYSIIATRGTGAALEAAGLSAQIVDKVYEGRPNIVDRIKDGDVQMVINTSGDERARADSVSLRQAALMAKLPYYTTLAGAIAVIDAMAAIHRSSLEVTPIQSYVLGNAG